MPTSHQNPANGKPSKPRLNLLVSVRVSVADHARWIENADARNLDLSDWLRRIANGQPLPRQNRGQQSRIRLIQVLLFGCQILDRLRRSIEKIAANRSDDELRLILEEMLANQEALLVAARTETTSAKLEE